MEDVVMRDSSSPLSSPSRSMDNAADAQAAAAAAPTVRVYPDPSVPLTKAGLPRKKPGRKPGSTVKPRDGDAEPAKPKRVRKPKDPNAPVIQRKRKVPPTTEDGPTAIDPSTNASANANANANNAGLPHPGVMVRQPRITDLTDMRSMPASRALSHSSMMTHAPSLPPKRDSMPNSMQNILNDDQDPSPPPPPLAAAPSRGVFDPVRGSFDPVRDTMVSRDPYGTMGSPRTATQVVNRASASPSIASLVDPPPIRSPISSFNVGQSVAPPRPEPASPSHPIRTAPSALAAGHLSAPNPRAMSNQASMPTPTTQPNHAPEPARTSSIFQTMSTSTPTSTSTSTPVSAPAPVVMPKPVLESPASFPSISAPTASNASAPAASKPLTKTTKTTAKTTTKPVTKPTIRPISAEASRADHKKNAHSTVPSLKPDPPRSGTGSIIGLLKKPMSKQVSKQNSASSSSPHLGGVLEALPVLPSESSNPLDFGRGVAGSGDGGKTIVLNIPLNGETNKYINFMQLAEDRYGWDALHPRAAAQRDRKAKIAAAASALAQVGSSRESGDEMSDEMSDAEASNGGGLTSGADAKPVKRKRNFKEDDYDKEDDFVDDSEMLWEAQAAASKDGFFVYSGPLIPEVPKSDADAGPPKRGKGSRGGRGGARGGAGSRGGATGRGGGPGSRGGQGRKPRLTKAEKERREREERDKLAALANGSALSDPAANPFAAGLTVS